MFLKSVFLFCISFSVFLIKADPFMEASPLNFEKLKPGEMPRQFLFQMFDSKYLCEKSNYSSQEKKIQEPIQNKKEDTFRVTCDGKNSLIIKTNMNIFSSTPYRTTYDCMEGISMFKKFDGCVCDSKYALTCYEPGKGLVPVGEAHSTHFSCLDSLKIFTKEYSLVEKKEK